MDYLPVGHPFTPIFDKQKQSLDFPSLYLGDDIRPSVVCRELKVGKLLKGYLHILFFDRKVNDNDLYPVQLLCNLAASQLTEYRHPVRSDQNDEKARFFRNILNHTCGSPDQILEKQKHLGVCFDSYIYALIIVYKKDSDERGIPFPDLGRQLAQRLPKGSSFIHKNTLFLLFSLEDMRTYLDPLLSPLSAILESYGLVMGVSYPFKSIIYLRTHADQALCALRIGSALDREETILYYKNYSIYHMLELSASTDTLNHFVLPQFSLLREHCRKNGDSLLTTVRVYLESQCNKSKTAEKLYTHPNAIKYRLAQAEEIMGLKLDDPENIMNLMLSFKILNYSSYFPPGDSRKES
jgi:sugar diacid utilization regulator